VETTIAQALDALLEDVAVTDYEDAAVKNIAHMRDVHEFVSTSTKSMKLKRYIIIIIIIINIIVYIIEGSQGRGGGELFAHARRARVCLHKYQVHEAQEVYYLYELVLLYIALLLCCLY
jgi:hypothetical protein